MPPPFLKPLRVVHRGPKKVIHPAARRTTKSHKGLGESSRGIGQGSGKRKLTWRRLQDSAGGSLLGMATKCTKTQKEQNDEKPLKHVLTCSWTIHIDAQDSSGNGQLVILGIRNFAPDHRPSRLPVREPRVLFILCILCIDVIYEKNFDSRHWAASARPRSLPVDASAPPEPPARLLLIRETCYIGSVVCCRPRRRPHRKENIRANQ